MLDSIIDTLNKVGLLTSAEEARNVLATYFEEMAIHSYTLQDIFDEEYKLSKADALKVLSSLKFSDDGEQRSELIKCHYWASLDDTQYFTWNLLEDRETLPSDLKILCNELIELGYSPTRFRFSTIESEGIPAIDGFAVVSADSSYGPIGAIGGFGDKMQISILNEENDILIDNLLHRFLGIDGMILETPIIKKTPGFCDGQAVIRDLPITVWKIKLLYNQGMQTEQIMMRFPELDHVDLKAVWEYCCCNGAEITATIESNVGEQIYFTLAQHSAT